MFWEYPSLKDLPHQGLYFFKVHKGNSDFNVKLKYCYCLYCYIFYAISYFILCVNSE